MTSSYCLNQKRIGPCFGSGPGVRPHFSLSSVSLAIEGVGAPTRRSARIAPGGVSGLLRTMRCFALHLAPFGAPTSIFGLTPYQLPGPARICLSLDGLPERRPWERLRLPHPQVPSRSPLARRLMRTPLEDGSGWAQHNYAASEVKRDFTEKIISYGELWSAIERKAAQSTQSHSWPDRTSLPGRRIRCPRGSARSRHSAACGIP